MSELGDILNRKIAEIEEKFYFAVADTHADVTQRIFEETKDYKGGDPKPYSTEPIWASRSSLPREAGKKSKSGKTRYFEGGYAELKKNIGRPPLELKGNLKLDFENGLRQINPLSFVVEVNGESMNKIKGNFVQFFRLSESEKDKLIERLK